MPVARVFVDTNIWVYAHLHTRDDARHARALGLVSEATGLTISPQVVAEYYSVMLRNAQPDARIQANLRAIFARTLLQPADARLLSSALAIRSRYGFSFWDCQIVAAALEGGCESLWTEDLQSGQVIEGRLQIVNPLLAI